MSTAGSKNVPNDWTIRGGIDLQGQADWYQTMFDACEKRSWVKGYALWSWTDRLYAASQVENHCDYEIFAKPAEVVVKNHYQKKAQA